MEILLKGKTIFKWLRNVFVMRLQSSTSYYRLLSFTFGMAFSSSQRFSFQILVFGKVTKCSVTLDEYHSNECDSTSKCTNLNTFMWSIRPKTLFLLMSVRGGSGSNVAHWYIFSIKVYFVYKLEEVVWCVVLWLLRNQGAPFLWCVLCTEVTQTDIPGAFFPGTSEHWVNVLDLSGMIISHPCQARVLL